MEGEIKNLIKVWLSITASLCYCYFISSRIPKGKYRLLSLLPIFSFFTFLPLQLTFAFPAAVVATFITWIATFKLLLFAFDRGPLSPNPPKSLALFITIACLPIRSKQIQNNPSPKSPKSTKPKKLPLNLGTEIVIFALLIGVLSEYREIMHDKIVLVVYCVLVFLLVEVLFSFSNGVVQALVGLELEPPSDEPYLSTSLQDFWGKRWNLTVTNTLRHTVFEPVRAATVAVVGHTWAPLLGVLASFVVSGLMHELLFFYVTRVSPSWEMTGFFVVHGVCVVAEMGVKRAVSGKLRLPWAVSWPLTVGFVVATSFWLFFPPLRRNGADVRVIEEFKMFVNFMKSNLILLASSIGI
ncbi:Long-chain-alcohol O-fatty-acyltransferase [Actinidia chinensis var. chinensis]|uniref:Long-chain-alcohol O-fatty-acyltransferase n=1 Tax=Actinidia chinensis var. chinensis TaxID=1590841 RepID=A0A2R6P4R7_ACTCC|nr:Long-chain-alcohol O-fatty-acyltransferase [Actinidia chinensis var. chinensis]